MQENNRNELERFDRERDADFLNMLKGFVLNQVVIHFVLVDIKNELSINIEVSICFLFLLQAVACQLLFFPLNYYSYSMYTKPQ